METKENAMLQDKQLDSVSGGEDSVLRGGRRFSGHVGKYSGVVGQNYYVLSDDSFDWFYGTLTKTYEEDVFFGLFGTNRCHEFFIPANGSKAKIDGDCWTMYTTMEYVK